MFADLFLTPRMLSLPSSLTAPKTTYHHNEWVSNDMGQGLNYFRDDGRSGSALPFVRRTGVE